MARTAISTGRGHTAALVSERIRGTEAHVLSALAMGQLSGGVVRPDPPPAEASLTEVMDGLRDRGLPDAAA